MAEYCTALDQSKMGVQSKISKPIPIRPRKTGSKLWFREYRRNPPTPPRNSTLDYLVGPVQPGADNRNSAFALPFPPRSPQASFLGFGFGTDVQPSSPPVVYGYGNASPPLGYSASPPYPMPLAFGNSSPRAQIHPYTMSPPPAYSDLTVYESTTFHFSVGQYPSSPPPPLQCERIWQHPAGMRYVPEPCESLPPMDPMSVARCQAWMANHTSAPDNSEIDELQQSENALSHAIPIVGNQQPWANLGYQGSPLKTSRYFKPKNGSGDMSNGAWELRPNKPKKYSVALVPVSPEKTCLFCKNNRETKEWYESHNLKDEEGRTTCPILRNYKCPICSATGDEAHTIKYCPQNQNSVLNNRTNAVAVVNERGANNRQKRNSRGVIGQYHYK